jgi:hypothetical protein
MDGVFIIHSPHSADETKSIGNQKGRRAFPANGWKRKQSTKRTEIVVNIQDLFGNGEESQTELSLQFWHILRQSNKAKKKREKKIIGEWGVGPITHFSVEVCCLHG